MKQILRFWSASSSSPRKQETKIATVPNKMRDFCGGQRAGMMRLRKPRKCSNNNNNPAPCTPSKISLPPAKEDEPRKTEEDLEAEEDPFKCQDCDYSTKSSSALWRHITHHNNTLAKFQCPHCSFGSKTRAGIAAHAKDGHNIKSIKKSVEICESLQPPKVCPDDPVEHIKSELPPEAPERCPANECGSEVVKVEESEVEASGDSIEVAEAIPQGNHIPPNPDFLLTEIFEGTGYPDDSVVSAPDDDDPTLKQLIDLLLSEPQLMDANNFPAVENEEKHHFPLYSEPLKPAGGNNNHYWEPPVGLDIVKTEEDLELNTLSDFVRWSMKSSSDQDESLETLLPSFHQSQHLPTDPLSTMEPLKGEAPYSLDPFQTPSSPESPPHFQTRESSLHDLDREEIATQTDDVYIAPLPPKLPHPSSHPQSVIGDDDDDDDPASEEEEAEKRRSKSKENRLPARQLRQRRSEPEIPPPQTRKKDPSHPVDPLLLLPEVKPSPKGVYSCKICEFRTTHRSALCRHKKMHQEVKKFKCGMCPFWSNFYGIVSQHETICHSAKKMSLSSPTRALSSRLSAKAGKESALLAVKGRGSIRQRNNRNGGGGGGVGSKTQSRKPSPGPPKKIYTCSKCSYSTTHRCRVYKHNEMHSIVKEFKCSICPFWSSLRGVVVNHESYCH